MSLSFGTPLLHKKGTLRDSLHQRAAETLTRKGIENAVICPEDVDSNEWIAVHAVDFYNDITILYGLIRDECTVESCPLMTAGDSFEFLWVDKKHYLRPTRLPAREYIDTLFDWLKEQLEDETLFPVEEFVPFPCDYRDRVQTIFRRMYRVYAHIWCSHHRMLIRCDCEHSFRFSLSYYLHFVDHFELVPAKEIRPLCALVNELTPNLKLVKEMNVIEASKREQASRRKQLPPVTARVGVSHFRGSRDGERRTSSIYYSQGTENRRETPVDVTPQESQRASAGVSADVSMRSTNVNVSSVGASGTPLPSSTTPFYTPSTPVSNNASSAPITNAASIPISNASTPVYNSASSPVYNNASTPIYNASTTPIYNASTTPTNNTINTPTMDSLHATVIEQEAPLDDSDPEEDLEEYDEEQRKSCTVV